MNNPIVKRYYLAVKAKLLAPLLVSNGDSYYSDVDVIRNGDGELFVPGTSLAGAMRGFLGKKPEENCLMGYSRGDEGKMSSLFFSDAYFEKSSDSMVSVRDGVRLKDGKTVENGGKYDYQIIETGAVCTFYLEYIRRKYSAEDEWKQVFQMLRGIQAGDIRFGAKKNRGFGRLRIEHVYKAEFDASSREQWLEFQKAGREVFCTDKYEYFSWDGEYEPRYVSIKIPLRLEGGISIRRYSAIDGKADYEHITCAGAPVIPGTSWNGAIRARAQKILLELGCKDVENKLNQWFGYVKEKEAQQSFLIFGESVLKDGTKMLSTRNRINRFDASTVEGALYSEEAYFGGTTMLEIKIPKSEEKNYKAAAGLMLLVADEIRNGYLAVGGQTAVGRGIFNGDSGPIQINDFLDWNECMQELAQIV